MTEVKSDMSSDKIVRPSIESDPGLTSAIVKRQIVDSKAEARRIVAEAQDRADQILKDAECAAKDLHEQAYQQGLTDALATLNQDLLIAREKRDSALAKVERDLLRLAIRIAEKICSREIDRDDATIAFMVRSAITHARHSETLTVRVNPIDLPIVEKYRTSIEPTGLMRFIEFVADPSIGRAGCLIVTETRTIDARLETQLRALELVLLADACKDTTPGEIDPAGQAGSVASSK